MKAPSWIPFWCWKLSLNYILLKTLNLYRDEKYTLEPGNNKGQWACIYSHGLGAH